MFETSASSENKAINKANLFQIWKKGKICQGKVCKFIANNQEINGGTENTTRDNFFTNNFFKPTPLRYYRKRPTFR